MKRREFITLLGGAAAASAWPRPARAQQGGRMRRVGVLMGYAEDDLEARTWLAAFRQGLEKLGWSDGRNVRIDTRFSAPGDNQLREVAKELIALQPEVIFATNSPATTALQSETRAIPVVFLGVSDPVGLGFTAAVARPGTNMTGFLLYEESITGKWLGMLKEIAPRLARVALMANTKASTYDHYLRAAQALAPSLSVEIEFSHVENAADIERTVEAFAREPNGGLLVIPEPATFLHRDLVIALAARHRLPAVYPLRLFVTAGGLMSYDTDRVEQYRQSASYVDRILRGDKPADLPVQLPTKYETVLNLKTAKALGLTVPDLLLVRADEVIE